MKQTNYLSRFTALVVLFSFLALTPALAQNRTHLPTFEAILLNENEASFYETTEPNTTIFSFPSKELAKYVHGLNRQKEVEFILKIGTLDATVILSANRGNGVSNSNVATIPNLTHRGYVRGDPDSKVSITISDHSFRGTIIANGKKYAISNAERDGKSMPNVFSLTERQYEKSTKKDDSPHSESLCFSVYIDLGVHIDELFVNHFSNFPMALDEAKSFAQDAISSASDIWFEIDDRINNIGIVWLEEPTQPDLYPENGDFDTWASNIAGNWAYRPCVRKDGIIYFTGRERGVRGQTSNDDFHCKNNKRGECVAIIGGPDNLWGAGMIGFTTAHEIGHIMGLGHEDEVCNQPCNSTPNLLMCTTGGDTATISSCMRANLNALTGTPESRCTCLAELIGYYTSDYCIRCEPKVTQFTVDNPNPIIDCATKSDIMNFSATIKGGCNATNQPIRAKFKKEFAQVEKDSVGRFSNYFTHARTLLGGIHIELIARTDPSLPDDDMTNPEIKVEFPNVDTQKDIDFKLKYAPGPTFTEGTSFVELYMGNNMQQIGVKEVIIEPFFNRIVQPGQTVLDVIAPNITTRHFQISGDLDFPSTLPPNLPNPPNYLYEIPIPGSSDGITGYNFTGFHFVMDAGNKFHLNGDTKLKLINATIEGCETMWAGIELDEAASIECVSSELKDAQYAIKLKGTAIADVRQTTFENNNYGFQALIPATSVPPIITLSGNTFVTTTTLKTPYLGQSPLPFAGKGYAGVYVDRVPSLNISSSGGMNSQFKNLHNGIISYKTNLAVGHTFFEDIQLVSGAPSLPGGITSPGKGIYSKNGSLVVKGEGILAANPATFTNCHTAVEGFQSTLSVTENKMLSVNNGVSSFIGVNKKVFISTNDIQAKDIGIGLFHSLALPNGCQVIDNTVRMIGNAQGIGIKTGGSGDFGQQEGLFSQNSIIVTDGAAGIDVGVSRNIKVTSNLVTLNNGSTNYGIGISGGDLNGVNCNTINGVGQKGIYGIMAGRSNFVCNTASGTGIGLNFEGVFVGKGAIRVAGNTMNNNSGDGLLMGTDAVIGEQVHQGNKWTGAGFSVAQHLGGFVVASKSKFTVDANENPSFIPNLVLPGQWFENIPTPSYSYQCLPNNPDCPIVQASSDYVREKEIAKGLLTGLYYQAPQLWTAQRRLYERLTEEGNPYPGDVDFTNFLTASQTNGIKAYADLQIGIRQMFQTSTTDRNDLATYETQLEQGLSQLALTEAQLNAPGISQQDSITLATQRNSTKQGLVNINTQRESKLNTIANIRLSLANSMLSQNNSLSGTGDYRTNEKTVNSIYLQTVAVGNNTFSASQLTTLQSIAAQCPLSGGEAVLRARDILALAQGTPLFYNNVNSCGSGARPSRDRTEQFQAGNFIQVRPNPASENITIKYELSDDVEHHMVLVNVFGQVMGDILLNGKEGEIISPIGNLPSGIYWYMVTGGNILKASGKLIINH